jgi:hypothetical protein
VVQQIGSQHFGMQRTRRQVMAIGPGEGAEVQEETRTKQLWSRNGVCISPPCATISVKSRSPLSQKRDQGGIVMVEASEV